MRVSELLQRGAVICRLTATRTEEAIREILEGLVEKGNEITRERLDDTQVALLKRESVGSTGFGHGVALPHAKLPYVRDFALGLGVSRSGVDFQSSDGRPVHVVFLVLSPVDDPYAHLRLMGLLAGIVRQDGFVDAMRRCASSDAVVDHIAGSETHLFPDE